MILGLAILTGFQLLGEVIRAAFSLPLPGPVIGMFLLAIVLATAPAESFPGKQLRKSLEDVSRMLIEHMGLLFVPAGVGIVAAGDLLRQEWLPIVVAVLVSTLLGLVVTGWVAHRLTNGRSDAPPKESRLGSEQGEAS